MVQKIAKKKLNRKSEEKIKKKKQQPRLKCSQPSFVVSDVSIIYARADIIATVALQRAGRKEREAYKQTVIRAKERKLVSQSVSQSFRQLVSQSANKMLVSWLVSVLVHSR